jgi:hypothetical protein
MKTITKWPTLKSFPPFPPVAPLEKAVRQAFDCRTEAMPDEFLYGPEFNREDHTPVDADPTGRKNLVIAFYDHAFELLDSRAMQWAAETPRTARHRAAPLRRHRTRRYWSRPQRPKASSCRRVTRAEIKPQQPLLLQNSLVAHLARLGFRRPYDSFTPQSHGYPGKTETARETVLRLR